MAKEIYILLTDTGTIFTRLIKLYTRAPYNHASIALDRELKEVYSFGRKRPHNPFIGGFVHENMQGKLFEKAKCAIYTCTVSDKDYEKIHKHILEMKTNQAQYKYNLLGLIAIILNKKMKRKNAYFCSQFVAAVFETMGTPLVNRSSANVTPHHLSASHALELIYIGKLNRYLQKKAEQPSIPIQLQEVG